jgi:hypothetical protein
LYLITAPSKDVGVISMAELRDIRNKTIKGNKADAVIISNDELHRIKKTMVIKSPEQKADEKKLYESKMYD